MEFFQNVKPSGQLAAPKSFPKLFFSRTVCLEEKRSDVVDEKIVHTVKSLHVNYNGCDQKDI